MLKSKLRHIKIFKSLFEQTSIQLGSTKPKVVRNTLGTGAVGKRFIEKMQKQSKEII